MKRLFSLGIILLVCSACNPLTTVTEIGKSLDFGLSAGYSGECGVYVKPSFGGITPDVDIDIPVIVDNDSI